MLENIEKEILKFNYVITMENCGKSRDFDNWLDGYLHGLRFAGIITAEQRRDLYNKYSPYKDM